MSDTGRGFASEEIKEESSWRYPIGIFIVTVILSAFVLYYYVGPSYEELTGDAPNPAVSDEAVALRIGDRVFAPPANYTVYPNARRGGAREEMLLYALWPTMDGYSATYRDEFVEDAADTRRIYISIAENSLPITEEQRLETLYMPNVVDKRGIRTPFQLTRFSFRDRRADVPTNGYAGNELYVGSDIDGKTAAFLCDEERPDISSPECRRTYVYADGVKIHYRFKRPYLAEWRAIDAAVRTFVANIDRTTQYQR